MDIRKGRLWFRAKNYGWGWYPVTWQGWVVVIGFILIQFGNFYRIDSASHSASDTVRPFLIETALLVAILIWICYKTGEKPEWRWGKKEK